MEAGSLLIPRIFEQSVCLHKKTIHIEISTDVYIKFLYLLDFSDFFSCKNIFLDYIYCVMFFYGTFASVGYVRRFQNER